MQNQTNKTTSAFQTVDNMPILPKSLGGDFNDLYGNKKSKVAIYCRLSEEDRHKRIETDDSESIQNQKSMLIKYATERQWEIFNIYSDDDYTGADRSRPEFCRLLADAEKRKFDIVLCKTQSRFTRELEIVERYIHGFFPLWNIRFISIIDNADTEIKGNKKARQINGLINEWYLEDMSENIKSVLTNRRQLGLHIGSFALYGFVKNPEKKGHLIIDEDAAGVVREIFALYSQGYGKTAIARILNERGIPNPTAYKRLKGHTHRSSGIHAGTLWSYGTISDILTNEMYIGNMVQGRYGSVSYKTKKNKPVSRDRWIIVEGTHEPIIDKELWEDVKNKASTNLKPLKTGITGLFAGKAKCINCGSAMRSSKSHGYSYLKCATKHVSKDACIGSFISVKLLSETVVCELNKLAAEYLDKDMLEQNIIIIDNHVEKKEKLRKEVAFYKKSLDEYSHGLRDLYLDKVKGIITEDDFMTLSKEFRREKDRFEALLSEAKELTDYIDNQMSFAADKKNIVKQYISITELNRVIVESFIDFIHIGRKDTAANDIPVEIHWNL